MKPKLFILKTGIILFAFIIFLQVKSLKAQSIGYGYDDSGNRVSKTIIVEPEKSTKESDKQPKFNDMVGDLEVTVYPNPTRGELVVDIINLPDDTPSTITVYDLSGKTVYTNSHLEMINRIDLTDQAQGTYILRIKSGDKISDWKIIKN